MISLGYGYGGMLSTWLRMKFYHTFSASVANSAPILMFYGTDKLSDLSTWLAWSVTNLFSKESKTCQQLMSWFHINLDDEKNNLNSLWSSFNILEPYDSLDDPLASIHSLIDWFFIVLA